MPFEVIRPGSDYRPLRAMAAFTPEQFQQLMAVITGQMQGAAAHAGVHGGRTRRLIDPKRFERMEKFFGGEEKWKEWSFDFRITVKA